MKSEGCEIPLIIVTGAGNEEIAVEAMKRGAYDYIVKSPDPGYIEILYLVIKQSVERHRTITEKKKLEKKIQVLVQAVDTSADGIIIVDKNRNITSNAIEEEIKFLYEQARNLADRDPLTGLLNHRRINELLEYEIERSKRRKEVFSIMMLDVDNLKLINDTHGHIV